VAVCSCLNRQYHIARASQRLVAALAVALFVLAPLESILLILTLLQVLSFLSASATVSFSIHSNWEALAELGHILSRSLGYFFSLYHKVEAHILMEASNVVDAFWFLGQLQAQALAC